MRIKDAAERRGSSINDIRHLLDYGKLTEYVFDPISGEPRYVSVAELDALPPYERKWRGGVGVAVDGETPLNRVSVNKRAEIKRQRQQRKK